MYPRRFTAPSPNPTKHIDTLFKLKLSADDIARTNQTIGVT